MPRTIGKKDYKKEAKTQKIDIEDYRIL